MEEITYKVRFRETNSDQWFEIDDVIEDSCYIEMVETPRGAQPMGSFPVKTFLRKDKSRVEVPMLIHVFEYSPEREQVIANKLAYMRNVMNEEEMKRQKKGYHQPPPGKDGRPGGAK